MADMEGQNTNATEEVDAIAQFQELTGIEDIEECRRKLAQHSWDLERAVHDVFNEKEGIVGVYNEASDEPWHRLNGEQEDQGLRRRANNTSDNVPQRRIVSRRISGRQLTWLEWGGHMILFPYRFFRSILLTFWEFINFFISSFRGNSRLGSTDPLADVENFIMEYEINYGEAHPNFFRGSYSQVLNEAKQNLQFLLVYLHGDDHQDTDEFCANILSNERVIQYINSNFLCWACNINSREGEAASQALRAYTYPFIGLIALKDNMMKIVARLDGLTSSDDLLERLLRCKEENETHLVAARLERSERQMNRNLREEQDAAYLESVRQDQEKERRRQEEIERIEREEQKRKAAEVEKQQLQERRETLKEKWKAEIPVEPDASHPDCVKIVIRLPSSSRLERRFLKTHSLKYLYYFVSCHEEAPDNFDITTNFPRRVLPCQPSEDFEPPTFEDENMTKQEMLYVYNHDA